MADSHNCEIIDLLKAAGVSSIAVASLGSNWSNTFKLEKRRSFCLEIQLAVDSGAPDIKIEQELGVTAPATEGTTDTEFTVPFAIGGGTNLDALVDSHCNTQLIRRYPFAPVVGPLQRLKFTGVSSNAASTRITRLRILQIES